MQKPFVSSPAPRKKWGDLITRVRLMLIGVSFPLIHTAVIFASFFSPHPVESV
jgi:hypothetical protein